jgi:hypothetical protein
MTERKDYVMKEGLCFACLSQGHMSKKCTNRSDCKKCQKRHPTCLHEDKKAGDTIAKQLQDSRNMDSATNRKVTTVASSLTSMVIPVFVSSAQNPEHEVLVYALLDTMSDSTFVLDTVVESLNATSEPTTLRVTTITDKDVIVSCRRYSDLRVRGMRSNKKIPLPTTYTRNDIPLDENHIPTPKTANRWSHLSRIEDLLAPMQACPAGLLIGYNCPRALAPLTSIVGKDGEPFAVETELGWSVVGGTMVGQESFDAIGSSHRLIMQEVPTSVCHSEKTVTFVYQTHIKEVSEDPADHASCGLSVDEISTSNWLTGPAFLWKKEITTDDIDLEISPHDAEVKSATVFTTQKAKFTSFEDRINRFSSYKKAVTAVAVIVKCCARKQNKTIPDLEARCMAERSLVRAIQKEAFGDSCEDKTKTNPLKDLDPFTDGYNLLRVGGRMRRAAEMFGVRHPLILPKNSHLSHLIAMHHHEKTAHQGRNLTMNEIRSRGYWIIGCRRVVSSLINKCVTCIKHRGKTKGQKMADLPKERVEPSPPFTYCGIDCFGPFSVKEGRKEVKRYGLIITCMAMRAVHIEVLDDLTTDSFINGLRCFIALRGKVRMICCDQGTNFVGAKHELKENLRKLDDKMIRARLLDLDCEFEFNPPSSSHMGGVWERQIRNIRNVLTGIMDSSASRLDTSSLRTFMYEAMAIVNSRPLTTENLERADGPLPLTPNHLLTMKSGIVMPPPPGSFVQEDLYLKKRWRRVQYLANLFWTRWKREYLQTLQTRKTWQRPQQNISIGDIVLLHDDGICRADWKIAKVVKTYPGDDGLVRKVELLMATPELDDHGKPLHKRTYLDRPVHKLVVLLPSEDLTEN